ncbi:MAG TPA: hypothetical protein VFP40_18700 [Terriglobales bacterium]|nr:hypothetical protein [Terriglobales bacterium]
MKRTPNSAKMFVGLVAIGALAFLGFGFARWESSDLIRFACFAILSMAASRMKITLPGLNGNMSVNLPFMLLAAMELSLSEALLVAVLSTAVQCLPKGGRSMTALQVTFNISLIVNAIGVAHLVAHQAALASSLPGRTVALVAAAVAFFLVDTVPVAIILGLAEGVNVFQTWKEIALLTFPFFVLSAGVVSMAAAAVKIVGWQIPLAIFPVMALIFVSYRRYFSRNASLEAVHEPFTSAAAAD